MRLLKQLIHSLESTKWEESLGRLSLEQKIAQLIHVPAWSNRGKQHLDELLESVEIHGIGGIIFFQGDAPTQAHWSEELQKSASVPLLVGLDAEWGLGMRLEGTPTFPYQMTLGALENADWIFEMGKEIGRQLRQIGTHINFAPVVDINTQANNPVIGFRSFGSQPGQVAAYAKAYAEGLEEAGVLPVIKHFPGHGDTHMDSHLTLPILPHDNQRLETIEMYPFRELVQEGIPAVMSAHLHIPAWDNRPKRAVTHSHPIISQKLRGQLGFRGLLFTDALT